MSSSPFRFRGTRIIPCSLHLGSSNRGRSHQRRREFRAWRGGDCVLLWPRVRDQTTRIGAPEYSREEDVCPLRRDIAYLSLRRKGITPSCLLSMRASFYIQRTLYHDRRPSCAGDAFWPRL